MNYSFHQKATREAEKAVLYYSEIYPELGESFREEIEKPSNEFWERQKLGIW